MTSIRPRRRTRGFSTAEVLAGTTLTLLLTASIYSFQRAQSKALAARSVYVDSQTITRSVMDLMTRELRMATFDPRGTALTTAPGPNCPGNKQGFIEATPTKLHFKQDLNGDGTISAGGEDVTYDLFRVKTCTSGNETGCSQIRRADGTNPPAMLVDDVPDDGLGFLYFDSSNPPVELVPSGSPPALSSGQRDCIAKVRVTAKARIKNPLNYKTPVTSMAESEVAVRNRSLNNF